MASSVYSLFQRCRYSVRKRMLRYTKLHGNSFYVRQKCRQFLIPLKNPNSINPLKWFCPKSFVCFYVLSYRLFDIFFVHVYVCDAKTCTNSKSAKWYVLSFYMSHFHSIPFYSIIYNSKWFDGTHYLLRLISRIKNHNELRHIKFIN